MRPLALCFALTACGGMQWHDAALEAGFSVLDRIINGGGR